MSHPGYRAVLVLGGIRSGKSEYAESLVSTATEVRYVATAAPAGDDDPEWAARLAAHRDRRPAAWQTDEVGAEPGRPEGARRGPPGCRTRRDRDRHTRSRYRRAAHRAGPDLADPGPGGQRAGGGAGRGAGRAARRAGRRGGVRCGCAGHGGTAAV